MLCSSVFSINLNISHLTDDASAAFLLQEPRLVSHKQAARLFYNSGFSRDADIWDLR